jgi:hypothetical protein
VLYYLYPSVINIEVIKLRKHVLCRGDEECHRKKSIGVYGSTVSEEGNF